MFTNKTTEMIGIVGGLGPFAGAHFFRTLLEKTDVEEEIDHLPTLLISDPNIADRSAFLEGESDKNPAGDILGKISTLKSAGARIIAIPCNQIFAPVIFDKIMESQVVKDIQVIHLIDELYQELRAWKEEVDRIGILARTGACKNGIFEKNNEYDVVYLPETMQDELDQAIASKEYGMKYHSSPISDRAESAVKKSIDYLRAQKVKAIVLGCTELSLAVDSSQSTTVPFIDTNEVLANASIRAYRLLTQIEFDIPTN